MTKLVTLYLFQRSELTLHMHFFFKNCLSQINLFNCLFVNYMKVYSMSLKPLGKVFFQSYGVLCTQMQQTNQRNHCQASYPSAPLVFAENAWVDQKTTGGLDWKGHKDRGQRVLESDIWLEVWRQWASHTRVRTHTQTHTELHKSLTEGHDSTFTMAVRWLEARFGWSCAWQHRLLIVLYVRKNWKGQYRLFW